MIKSFREEVFGRCCEFVYSGDYSAPSLVREFWGDNSSQLEDIETQRHGVARRWDRSNLTWNLFYLKVLSLSYNNLLKEIGWTLYPETKEGFSNDCFTSYREVFLSHAEMHHFAVRTGWLSLAHLSSYRLL